MNTNLDGGKTVAGRTNDGGGRRRSLWKSPALITVLILLIPLMGNHFIDGWNWRPGGFVVLGALLFGLGFTYELVTRKRDTIAYRAAVGIAFAAALFLTWGELGSNGRRQSCRRDVFRDAHCGGYRRRPGALAAKRHGPRLIRHCGRSSLGHGGRAADTDYSKSSGYFLDRA